MPQAPFLSASRPASSASHFTPRPAAGHLAKLRNSLALTTLAICLGLSAPATHAQTAHAGAASTTWTGPYIFGLAVDAAGNVFGDNYGSGTSYKVAFSGSTYTLVNQFTGFGEVGQIAIDSSGNFYFSDFNNGVTKFTYSGGIYTKSVLNSSPGFGVAVDSAGDVFYTVYPSGLYELKYNGVTYAAPVRLNTATYQGPYGVNLDTAGNIYVADAAGTAIYKYTRNGSTYTETKLTIAGLYYPESAVPDSKGNLYIHNINGITFAALNAGVYTASTIAPANNEGYTTQDPYGTVYAATGSGSSNSITRLAVGPATVVPSTAVGTAAAAQIPVTFTIDTAGTLPALTNANVLTQGASGLDFTLGTGSTCTGAVTAGQVCTVNVIFTPKFPGQRLGAVNLYDSTGTNVIATAYISGTGTGPLLTLSPGLISTVAGNGTPGYTASQDTGTTAATAASLYNPAGVAVDGAGNLYIADYINNRVRKVTAATGFISTVAGNGAPGYTASQDTGTTAATAASIYNPLSVAVDGAGNLYIADFSNSRIRKVTAAGFISTVAGNGTAGYTASQDTGTTAATATSLNDPNGIAVDAAGNLYIADYYNQRIRKVTAATGFISTVAGNGTGGYTASQDTGTTAATAASLNYPFGIAVDGAGNLYIADQSNNRIRKVTAATGFISTVAGNGTGGYTASQDTGTTAATAASLYQPAGVAVDGAGNLYIADQYNQRIRKVTAGTGTISTVAGNGTAGYTASQDTGTTAATAASLNYPRGVAVDGAGNLYIADSSNQRIRKVSTTGSIVFPTATAAGAADTTDGTQTLIANNIGNATLTFASQVETGSSFVLGNPMTGGCVPNGTIAAGGSCLIGATFAPVAGTSGLVAGSVTLTDNSLNATAATQSFPQVGSTTANAVVVTVGNVTAQTAAASATLQYTYGQSGSTADTGAITITVNGSATGVGASTCVKKASHSNCTFPYTGSALGAPGNYTISVAIAASSPYAAASATGTLTINSTGMGIITPPQTVTTPVTLTATPAPSRTVTAPILWQSPIDSPASSPTPVVEPTTDPTATCTATAGDPKKDKVTSPTDCRN